MTTRIDRRFTELKAQACINPVANALDDVPDFSQRIRKNRAGFEFPRSDDIASPRARQGVRSGSE